MLRENQIKPKPVRLYQNGPTQAVYSKDLYKNCDLKINWKILTLIKHTRWLWNDMNFHIQYGRLEAMYNYGENAIMLLIARVFLTILKIKMEKRH